MSVFGTAHPLDVDLADLAEGILDGARAARVETHVAGCLVCRIRLDRLLEAPPVPLPTDRALPSPGFTVPAVDDGPGEPGGGELWLAGADDRVMVLVLRTAGDRVLVAPVTFDVEAADDEALVVDAADSPLATGLAIHPRLATEVPRSVLVGRLAGGGGVAGDWAVGGGRLGAPIVDASDPRLEVRQLLADRLGSLEETPPDPATGADAPPLRPEHLRSSLIGDLRSLRGRTCTVRPLFEWGDVLLAHQAGWDPIATVDELGVVLVVLDTPHGLVDDVDFDAGRSVLTRFNATALVVLAFEVSDLAEVFDSSSLNYGIDAPSGHHTPPRPLISGLAPFDAISKYLDQSTGVRAAAPAGRGPVTRVDVGDILRESAAAAIAEVARQGSRFKIAPKRRGYESIVDDAGSFAAALGGAFGPEESLVQDLLAVIARADG